MARARASEDTMSMSFLDVLSCALGATVVLYLVLSSSARSNARPHETQEATTIPVMLEVNGPSFIAESSAMRCFDDDMGISVAGSRMFLEWVDDDMHRRALAEVRTIRSMSRFVVRGSLEGRTDKSRVLHYVTGSLAAFLHSPEPRFNVLVSHYSIMQTDQNASTEPEYDSRDPSNTIVTLYCRPSVYSASWPRSPRLERLQVDHVASSSSSVGRWLGPAFNVRRSHELRVCGLRQDPTIRLHAAVSGAAGQQCAEQVAPYIDGCYRAIFEPGLWSAPSSEHCLVPQI